LKSKERAKAAKAQPFTRKNNESDPAAGNANTFIPGMKYPQNSTQKHITSKKPRGHINQTAIQDKRYSQVARSPDVASMGTAMTKMNEQYVSFRVQKKHNGSIFENAKRDSGDSTQTGKTYFVRGVTMPPAS